MASAKSAAAPKGMKKASFGKRLVNRPAKKAAGKGGGGSGKSG